MNFTYEDEGNKSDINAGYGKLTITNGLAVITNKSNSFSTEIGTSVEPLKARMPSQKEIVEVNCSREEGSCPSWLVENIKYWDGANNKYLVNSKNITGTAEFNISGYLLLSTNSGYALSEVVTYKGKYASNEYGVTSTNMYGIRPVITVPLSDLN